jgi:hypothetical protein
MATADADTLRHLKEFESSPGATQLLQPISAIEMQTKSLALQKSESGDSAEHLALKAASDAIEQCVDTRSQALDEIKGMCPCSGLPLRVLTCSAATIKQIYLEAITAGLRVEEEIEKSSCGRHLQAIADRQARRKVQPAALITSIAAPRSKKSFWRRCRLLPRRKFRVAWQRLCMVCDSKQVPQPGRLQQQQKNGRLLHQSSGARAHVSAPAPRALRQRRRALAVYRQGCYSSPAVSRF